MRSLVIHLRQSSTLNETFCNLDVVDHEQITSDIHETSCLACLRSYALWQQAENFRERELNEFLKREHSTGADQERSTLHKQVLALASTLNFYAKVAHYERRGVLDLRGKLIPKPVPILLDRGSRAISALVNTGIRPNEQDETTYHDADRIQSTQPQ